MTLPQNRQSFEELMKKWIVIEDNTINTADDLMSKSKNPMLKAIIDLLKRDSEKHKHTLEAIQYSLNHTVTFNSDDMNILDSFIEKHALMEKNAVETAEQALEMSSLPIPRFLLENLLNDEKKHDAYIEELTALKYQMTRSTQ